MENEKRKVGDYTVLCAVNIGSREIILAENEQDSSGERFLCCYGERNDIFEKFTECAVGDDYIDAALFFAERIKRDAELFRSEVEKLDIPVTVITEADCIPDHYKNDINGKIIAINPAILKPEYQRADRQLFLVTGGFGASAKSLSPWGFGIKPMFMPYGSFVDKWIDDGTGKLVSGNIQPETL